MSPLVVTKLHIPQPRTNLVLRPRLMARLTEGLEKRLTLISAPAGYGKTTLLSEWLSKEKFNVAWISLDKRDNDPVRFWSYVVNALHHSFLSPQNTPFEVPTNLGIQVGEALIEALINDLVQFAKTTILVLDDYHCINNQSIHKNLAFLIDNAPGNLHLIISTRADPPLPLARLRARSQMVEIRLTDLRFTTQESTDFFHSVMGMMLSREELTLLETRTEGWVAGLQMAGLSLQGNENPSSFLKDFSGEDSYILDFLFDEVFKHQPIAIQNFLLKTSNLEQFCGSLCDAVTSRVNSQEILETLDRRNLFLISLDDRRRWYRYHGLFADLLKSRLKQIYPQDIDQLHRKASVWYAVQGYPEQAIHHSLIAKDYATAADQIEQIVSKLDKHNKQALLTQWLDSLPQEVLEKHPWLCVHRAYSYYWIGRRDLEEEWLRLAETNLEIYFKENDPEKRRIQGHIAAIRALVALSEENIPVILTLGKKALDLLPNDYEMCCETNIALGGAYWALGNAALSEQAFRQAQIAALKVSNTLAVPSTCYIGAQQIKQGRLKEAIATFREGRSLATLANGTETMVAGCPLVKLGDVYRELNELDQAYQHLSRGLELCLQLGQSDFIAEAYVCFGRYQLAVGDISGCFETISKVDQGVKQTRIDAFLSSWLEELRLKAWIAEGNLDLVLDWILHSGLGSDDSINYLHDLHHINLARALLINAVVTSDYSVHQQANHLLERLRDAAHSAGWVHEEIKALVLQAMNYQVFNNQPLALQKLAQALCLAEPGGFVRVFVDEGVIVQRLLEELAVSFERETENPFIQQGKSTTLKTYLIKILSAFPPPSDVRKATLSNLVQTGNQERVNVGDHLVEHLSEREIDVLRLLAEGYSDQQIAETLIIARGTVHKHLKNIYEKLNVHRRTEAVAKARSLNLL